MITPADFTLLAIAIYVSAALFGLAALYTRSLKILSASCFLSLGAFLFQTLILALGYHASRNGILTYGDYLQMLAWFSLLCGIAAWLLWKNKTLLLFSTPFGLILFLLSSASLALPIRLPAVLSASFYALHIGALFLSIGILSIGFICAIIFFILEKKIKVKRNIQGFLTDMPAIAILDKINSFCALSVFPLYTVGIIAGLAWGIPVFGKQLATDPKDIASIFIWCLLAILFHNRLAKNWKGKKPAMLLAIIFVLSLFSFFFINFLMNTHHYFINTAQ